MTRYTLLGIVDDVTTCDLCGKPELKCTMALSELDADGNEVGVVYFGRDCGARSLGWKVSADRAEKIARKEEVRWKWDDLYPIAARAATTGGAEGEIDGIRIRAYRTFNAREKSRLVASGEWFKGPADLVWRYA